MWRGILIGPECHPVRAGFKFEKRMLGDGFRVSQHSGLRRGKQARRSEDEILPAAAWRPFHVLTPILQVLVGWGALWGVLPSRGIPRGCVATAHHPQIGGRGGEEKGNARHIRVDGKGEIEIKGR